MRFAIRSTVVAACLVLLAAAASAQATLQIGGAGTLTLKGFVSFTGFAQDQQFTFGNGQNAEYPNPPNCKVDCWFGGGDVRQTRLTMVFNGPTVIGNWKVNATIETDFFGGNNGTGAFSGQQEIPRLRLGFLDFTNGSTTIRLGQQWAPLFGNTAVSLAHIAFPLGYGSAGDIGWRFPGIFVYQNLTAKDAVVAADVQLAVMSGAWNGPECTTTNNCINFDSAGNGAAPQFEARFNLGGKAGDHGSWSTYIVGHYDQKDLSGPGAVAPNDKLNGSVVEVGAKFQFGPFMLQGNGYAGHNIGQQFSTINQFGKIFDKGGWAQVGFDITPIWSVFLFGGLDDPKNADVLAAVGAAGRMKNEMLVGMLRWKCGPLAFGLEYMRDKLKTGALEVTTTGNQWAFSGLYNF
jgi:hypothetical protein